MGKKKREPMKLRSAFNTELYENIFSKYIADGDCTQGDEILVDMDEPRGKKISFLISNHSHHVVNCKAFVATTKENLLVAVFNLYGRFHECYVMKLQDIQNVNINKCFGGMSISFEGYTQYGRITMKMYAANRQFGTDLKRQKEHLALFAEHLNVKHRSEDKCTYIDSKQIDKITANELSEGFKIVYNGKTYNNFGNSKAKGYIVISSALPEEGFMIGEEFNHTIPQGIGLMEIDKSLYYKKILPEQIEDFYFLKHETEYAGIRCSYSVSSLGNIKIVIDERMLFEKQPELEQFVCGLGFVEKMVGDNSWDYRKIFIKENVPIEDEKFDIKVYKNYTKKMAAPYDLCHIKHNDERIYVDVNIKNIVKNSINRD